MQKRHPYENKSLLEIFLLGLRDGLLQIWVCPDCFNTYTFRGRKNHQNACKARRATEEPATQYIGKVHAPKKTRNSWTCPDCFNTYTVRGRKNHQNACKERRARHCDEKVRRGKIAQLQKLGSDGLLTKTEVEQHISTLQVDKPSQTLCNFIAVSFLSYLLVVMVFMLLSP